MTTLSAHQLSYSIGRSRIIDDVSVDVRSKEVLGLIGPNGAGKTSLLRLLAGLRRPDCGAVELGGRALTGYRRREIARLLAIVEQAPEAHADITVEQAVSLGRTPHRGPFAALDSADHDAIETALTATGMLDFRSRAWQTLSGGERQRVQLARALAQQPEIIVLDEPTNHLDIRFQLEVLTLLRQLGLTVVTALHDLNLAARFCDRIAVLREGRLVATGTPRQVLTADLIDEVYRVEAVVEMSPHTNAPTATYLHPSRPGVR